MADGITRIAVEGFKSISKRQSIEIAPLTILAGANSSGKSSIMQPLLMLKQTLEQTTDPGPLWIGGPNVKFTSSDQFFSRTAEAAGRMSVELATQHFEFQTTFARARNSAVEIYEVRQIRSNRVSTLRPTMQKEEIRSEMEAMFPMEDGYWDLAEEIVPDRFFLDIRLAGGSTFHAMKWIARSIQGVIHVQGFRGNTERAYPTRAVTSNFPGGFQEYTGSVIHNWQTENASAYALLNEDLRRAGLAPEVVAQRLSDVSIELLVKRLDDPNVGDLVSVADVGFGVLQTLPVIVALRVASKGQLVYLEEPEMHLHPRAQVKLADILSDAAKRGVRVVAETHSTLLLTAIQTLVAKGELNPELVKLHWFQRDAKTGVTEVTSTDLDENGTFVQSDWPEDFDDVILKADGAYLDAVESRQAR
jgi:predicted ATPase